VARGRKLPVPDDRPSEKIAKLFPQTDPLKDPKNAAKPSEVTSATNARPTAQTAVPPTPAAVPSPAPTVQAAVAKPIPLPEPRPKVEAVSVKPQPRHLRRYRYRR
jgi:membrane-bound lytic murein transglycosylase A